MSVLVYIDASKDKIAKNSFEAACYASKIAQQAGTSTTAIVNGNSSNVNELEKYGVTKVLQYNSNDTLDDSQLTQLVNEAANQENSDTIIFSQDLIGKAVAPRIAIKQKAGLISGAIELPNTDNGFTIKVNAFSGKAFANLKVNSEKKVIALLPNSIPVEEIGGSAEIVSFEPSIREQKVKIVDTISAGGDLPLPEAELVVSGGRGLKGPENWGIIEELAKELGAATACSRPVADSHWRPHHEHVGQTGVAIRPNLYIAAGISGAIQHLAGVNGSKVIVVINTDSEAPFFKAADYGIVGDAFEVLPKLTEAVKKFKASQN